MAKGKNLNPADAERKAQRKKEIKKNKTERSKAKELATAKKDTSSFETEIAELQEKTSLTTKETQRLNDLKSEVAYINKAKEDYVAEHPEHRNLVYRSNRRRDNEQEAGGSEAPRKPPKQKNYYDKNGLPRHPERSIYYDAVFNPYGAPPPGMPFIERPPLPGEVYSDEDEDGDEDENAASDDDIAMPDDAPPEGMVVEGGGEVVESDDDIPLPDGPPPPKDGIIQPPPLPMPLPLSHFAHPPFLPPFPPTMVGSGVPTMHMGQPQQDYTRQSHISAPPVLLPPAPPSLPSKPARPISEQAVVSAEPELRDLKKESTAFIPASLKRKKVKGARVNANPSVEEVAEVQEEPASEERSTGGSALLHCGQATGR